MPLDSHSTILSGVATHHSHCGYLQTPSKKHACAGKHPVVRASESIRHSASRVPIILTTLRRRCRSHSAPITEDREDKESQKGMCLKRDEWQNTHGFPVKHMSAAKNTWVSRRQSCQRQEA